MNKEEIEKQLKLSKRQSKDERYDYLCSEFNAINYCINLEKYTNKLQQENKILKENAENNDKVVDKVNWENQLLKKENEQLKDNWNKLKKFIKDKYVYYEKETLDFFYGYKVGILGIRDKMQELEQGSDK